MQQPRRATLKDVARHTRLSLSAVSLALRKPKALPTATVARVREAAEAVGYVPDPALTALAAYRGRQRVRRDFAVIGLVSNWSKRNEWFHRPSAQTLWEGASVRARALGYTLQHLWAREAGATPARFSQILLNCGIRGLILAPFEHPDARFELPWANFAVVTIERPTHYTTFHHVVPSYFADMLLVWDQLRMRGYRRIGLALDHGLAERAAHQWEAAHAFEQARSGETQSFVPTLVTREEEGPAGVLEWLRTHRPDAIVSRSDRVFPALREAGVRLPIDLGYVSLNVIDDAPGVSGILQPRDIMGAAAVDALNAQLLVSQRGPGECSVGTHVDGVWNEGTTVGRGPASAGAGRRG